MKKKSLIPSIADIRKLRHEKPRCIFCNHPLTSAVSINRRAGVSCLLKWFDRIPHKWDEGAVREETQRVLGGETLSRL